MPGIVSALEVQKRNKERVNVFLDGEYAFSLAMIEAARLHKGQVLSDEEIADLQARDAIEWATDLAVRYLSYRPRSIHEIRQHLTRKELTPQAVDAALDRLEKLGYVDDLAFARFWVGNRDDFRPKGPLALRQELREKGISKSISDQAIGELDFQDAAYRAAYKQAARYRDLDRRAFQQKMYPFLARRGFLAETVRDVLDRLMDELEVSAGDPFDDDIA